MDELPQRAFIGPETISPIEAAQSRSAERASSIRVQGEMILKRSPAGNAEIFRRQGLRRTQAGAAHRYAGYFGKGFFTDPAIVGEKK
jgi:hypothetical protein